MNIAEHAASIMGWFEFQSEWFVGEVCYAKNWRPRPSLEDPRFMQYMIKFVVEEMGDILTINYTVDGYCCMVDLYGSCNHSLSAALAKTIIDWDMDCEQYV